MPRRAPAYRWAAGCRAPSASSARNCSPVASAPTPGCSSSACCSSSAPSASANAMHDFLQSIGYNSWILPTLLALPLIGALVVLFTGRRGEEGEDEVASGAARGPRVLATAVFALEFILSIGLW